jgi:hypothetical protein
MAWHLKGSYFETCSCDLLCPCIVSMDHGASNDYCRITLVFNIHDGEIEGTDVGGIRVVLVVESPQKDMTEGNWSLGMFIDERASDEQMEKLTSVFGGQKGGPMESLTPLVGNVLGVERASIEIDEHGVRHSVKVGDAIDFEVEDIVPFGIEAGDPVRLTGVFYPLGSELVVAEAKRSSIDAFGIQYEGKSGLSKSEFSWAA